jgi:hypothetical protein
MQAVLLDSLRYFHINLYTFEYMCERCILVEVLGTVMAEILLVSRKQSIACHIHTYTKNKLQKRPVS